MISLLLQNAQRMSTHNIDLLTALNEQIPIKDANTLSKDKVKNSSIRRVSLKPILKALEKKVKLINSISLSEDYLAVKNQLENFISTVSTSEKTMNLPRNFSYWKAKLKAILLMEFHFDIQGGYLTNFDIHEDGKVIDS